MNKDDLTKYTEPKNQIDEKQVQFSSPKGIDAFTKIDIEIEAKHLKEEGTQRLVLSDWYRLKGEVNKLNDTLLKQSETLDEFKEKFYEVSKEKAILEEKLKVYSSFEIIYTAGIAIGSAIVAAARILTEGNTQFYFTAAGFIIILVSIFSKLYNYNFSIYRMFPIKKKMKNEA